MLQRQNEQRCNHSWEELWGGFHSCFICVVCWGSWTLSDLTVWNSVKVWRSSPGDEGAACLLVAKGQDRWKVKGLSSESISVQSLAPPNAAGWLKLCLDGSRVSATMQTTCDPHHAFTLWMLMGMHSCPGLLLLHSKCNNIQSFIGHLSASGYRLSVSYDSHMTHQMTDVGQTESMLNQTDLWFFRGSDDWGKSAVNGHLSWTDGASRRPTAPHSSVLLSFILHQSAQYKRLERGHVTHSGNWANGRMRWCGEAGHQPIYLVFTHKRWKPSHSEFVGKNPEKTGNK